MFVRRFPEISSRSREVQDRIASSERPPTFQIGRLPGTAWVTMDFKESFPIPNPLFAANMRPVSINGSSSLVSMVDAPFLYTNWFSLFSKLAYRFSGDFADSTMRRLAKIFSLDAFWLGLVSLNEKE